MTQELRKRVVEKFRELTAAERLEHWPITWEELADAAIAIIRGETLEEAARDVQKTLDEHGDPLATERALAAIRALGEKP